MKFLRFFASLLPVFLILGVLATAASAKVTVGQKAPDFTSYDAISNDAVSLDSLLAAHRAVILIFVSTQSIYSNGYNTRIEDIFNKYGESGVNIVGINSNEDESDQDVVEQKFEHKLDFQILKDNDNVVADKYGATVTPEAFLIDTNGTIIYHGRIDNSLEINKVKTHDLTDALDAYLAGKPILTPETKPFGDEIHRNGLQ